MLSCMTLQSRTVLISDFLLRGAQILVMPEYLDVSLSIVLKSRLPARARICQAPYLTCPFLISSSMRAWHTCDACRWRRSSAHGLLCRRLQRRWRRPGVPIQHPTVRSVLRSRRAMHGCCTGSLYVRTPAPPLGHACCGRCSLLWRCLSGRLYLLAAQLMLSDRY